MAPVCNPVTGEERVLPPGRSESCHRGGESPATGEERVLPLGRKESCCWGGKSPAAGDAGEEYHYSGEGAVVVLWHVLYHPGKGDERVMP